MVDVVEPAFESTLQQSVALIGAGPAGLITGYTLLRDGFQNVQLLTRDKSVGGVWAKERIYPGMSINSVHGEFRFSPLPMPPPMFRKKTGYRLSGEDMSVYMEKFADTFLAGKIRFETEVLDVRRGMHSSSWEVEVLDLRTGTKEVLSYARVILCTGGCSQTLIPDNLSANSAKAAGFLGPVVHSVELASHGNRIIKEAQTNLDYSVVVIGGGKSAQDASAHLARHGVKVTMIFEQTEALLAYPIQLPESIRKSRLLSLFSSHIHLRTRLERFLHTTTLGTMITRGFWNFLTWSAFDVLRIPKNSPLRNTRSLFWAIHTTDIGTWRLDGFHGLVHQGKIKIVAPNRVQGYSSDGESIVLQTGQTLRADAVILATGFSSSWTRIFTEETMEELGIGRCPPWGRVEVDEWSHYRTLASPPTAHPKSDQLAPPIYRGLVPAKNITKRDFAINGAVFTTNGGYAYEVMAHWISSYFLGDSMRLPSTVEEALAETARNAAWIRKRYPNMLLYTNESYSSNIAFWSWPQATDDLLEDMGLPIMRSGGNWLTWPFKVISADELATLGEERRARRVVCG